MLSLKDLKEDEDGVEFIKKTIGALTKPEVKEIYGINDTLVKRVEALEKELAEVKAKLPAPPAVE